MNNGAKWIAGFAIALLLAAFLAPLVQGEPTPRDVARESRRDLLRDIRVECELAVQRRLVSPSTMRTNPVKDPTATTRGVYEYGLVIDSQNSFGAMIRSVWRCDYHPINGVEAVVQLQ